MRCQKAREFATACSIVSARCGHTSGGGGHHTGYRLSGILGDDGTHRFEKYSRRRTTSTSWRTDTAAADLMPFTA
jgi:hypothetical protein